MQPLNYTEGVSVDVLICGAGFLGIGLAAYLHQKGNDSVLLFDRAKDVGGTWYWNSYPGASCDIESYWYSFSLFPEIWQKWKWSQTYAYQPEILEYARFVAKTYKLYEKTLFETNLKQATWDESMKKWKILLSKGPEIKKVFASHLVLSAGPLSIPLTMQGIEDFIGKSCHTARWDSTIDFTGKTVGVIGTGASAVQVIPELAKCAKHVYVFQRTPNWVLPRVDAKTDSEFQKKLKESLDYWTEYTNFFASFGLIPMGESLKKDLEKQGLIEQGFSLMLKTMKYDTDTHQFDFAVLEEILRNHISKIVKNPEIAKLLTPNEKFFSRRPPLSGVYYETFNRENVTLIDVSEHDGVSKIGKSGPIYNNKEYNVDNIVIANGFDAITGEIMRMDIEGRNGIKINEKWGNQIETFGGLHVNGFPNMYITVGPQSPSVLGNMIFNGEIHIKRIVEIMEYMKSNGYKAIETTKEAEDDWIKLCEQVRGTLEVSVARNWYNKGNITRKVGQSMPFEGGHFMYIEELQKRSPEALKFS